MNSTKIIIKLAIIAATLLLAPCIYANPIVITTGNVAYSRSGPMTFFLAGSGFNTTGVTSALNPSVSLFANGPIFFGATGQTGGSIDTQDGELSPVSPITVGGTAFSPTSLLLQLGFSSQSFVAPLQPSSGFVVVAPFTLNSGLIEGYPGLLGQGVALFSGPLTGSGTTTLTYTMSPSGLFVLQSQIFVFGQTVGGVTVQAVPEPVSVWLLLSALAGLCATRKPLRFVAALRKAAQL